MAEGQGRSSNQGVKLLYIRDYLHKYTNKEHPKSAKEISEYLASKGIKADRKTIYNDILRLQVDFQEPIEYNPKKWGYYVTKPQLSRYEIRLLLDSVYKCEMLTTEETNAITKKILELINTYDAASFSEELKQRAPSPKAEASVVRNAEIIREAIATKKKISFRYYKRMMVRENNYKKYYNLVDEHNDSIDSDALNIVNPKALEWFFGGYSMTIYSNDHFPWAYSLYHMEDIKILNQECEYLMPEPIEDEKMLLYMKAIDKLRKGMGREKEEEISAFKMPKTVFKRDGYELEPWRKYAVTIRIAEGFIEDVLNFWGNETQIIPYDNDYVMFTVHTPLLPDLFIWLLQQGSAAKILAPKEAIGELFRFLKKTETLYGYGTDKFLKDIPTTYDEMRSQKHSL